MERIVINELYCDGCEACIDACPAVALYMENGQAFVDYDLCTVCQLCIPECHIRAISVEEYTK